MQGHSSIGCIEGVCLHLSVCLCLELEDFGSPVGSDQDCSVWTPECAGKAPLVSSNSLEKMLISAL